MKTDLSVLSVAELTSMYNERVPADKRIKKFETKAKAIARLMPLIEAEAKMNAAEKPAKTVAAKSKGPKRIDLITDKLRQGMWRVDVLAIDFSTTEKVIRNDLCDIRKALPLGERLARSRVDNDTFYQIVTK